MKVTRIFTFEAAHKLPGYPGLCGSLHGHSYILHVTVEGPVHENGMVIDFSDLKAYVQAVLDRLDHTYLNSLIAVPTAENILLYLQKELALSKGSLTLYETAKCYATLDF